MSENKPQVDLKSFEAHDPSYKDMDVKEYGRVYKNLEVYNQYEILGYNKVVDSYPGVRGLHIDVGCGGGWLLVKTAPIFSKVVGIDPSVAALEGAKEVTKDFGNVELMEADMVEALKKLGPTEPVFITTTTVLSHIQDEWVTEFLKLVNFLPKGSILHFGEPYDKNIQRKLWYIRGKDWWAKNLPNWQLTFSDTVPAGYKYGISGHCVGQKNVISFYPRNWASNLFWRFSGFYYSLRNWAVGVLKSFINLGKNKK